MSIDPELLAILKAWKQTSQFSADGELAVCISRSARATAVVVPVHFAGVPESGKGRGNRWRTTYTLRHSYRSWLDAVGTPIAVQQKLMRHSDIRTTMNLYGDVVTDEMAQAHSKVVGLALAQRKPD